MDRGCHPPFNKRSIGQTQHHKTTTAHWWGDQATAHRTTVYPQVSHHMCCWFYEQLPCSSLIQESSCRLFDISDGDGANIICTLWPRAFQYIYSIDLLHNVWKIGSPCRLLSRTYSIICVILFAIRQNTQEEPRCLLLSNRECMWFLVNRFLVEAP